ncbi:DUF2793 domain-containing protein [Loktanella sp. M215]|uniref:DUF2793 domain-containing protein n=1 Tax=Loktanella sp. M215 TaxID=2675431 RepID=UPI001F2FB5BD|nr:DUF2793 domain-containing protein [Loktanella sp. M215]MCF7702131.1 DUF2793 domain-containing protein [Loktanella sp. M215]
MTTFSPRLDLPFIEAAQAQKHVTHNAALERLDVIVQLCVQQFNAKTPPASPVNGQSWALGTTPTGVWAGRAGQIATFAGDGWLCVIPGPGWRAWGLAESALRIWTGTAWAGAGLGAGDLNNLPGVGINATSDSTNRLSVAAEATLFNHAGRGHQIKINKSAAGDTASLLYQTNYGGRAEMGLAGNDDFALKVSADGGTWNAALTAQAATGGVTLHHLATLVPGTAPAAPARGTVYYDDAGEVLRCFDGAVWRDLF